jgi:hypothetical protein
VTYNPFGGSGSIVVTPSKVKVSRDTHNRTRARNGKVVARRADGTIITPAVLGGVVRLRKTKPTPSPSVDTRAIELEERKRKFAEAQRAEHLRLVGSYN